MRNKWGCEHRELAADDQQSNIQAAGRDITEVLEDRQARSLASGILGANGAHLVLLNQFLSQTEPVMTRDQICLPPHDASHSITRHAPTYRQS